MRGRKRWDGPVYAAHFNEPLAKPKLSAHFWVSPLETPTCPTPESIEPARRSSTSTEQLHRGETSTNLGCFFLELLCHRVCANEEGLGGSGQLEDL